MQRIGSRIVSSATDLSNFLGCRHRTALDLSVADGKATRPFIADPLLEILAARGLEHETRYVDSLRERGLTVASIGRDRGRDARVAATLDALRRGVDVVVQAALATDDWGGYADILQKVPKPGAFGDWSYEVADTKLALDTRAGTILQLSLYSDMLADIQGVRPEWFYVITPDPVQPVRAYRVDDYAAYYRLVRAQMGASVAAGDEALAARHYPEPVDSCDICAWSGPCRARRRADDHLSLVAGISRVQRDELVAHGVGTLTDLAGLAVPLPFKPGRGAVDTYVRVREQARLQHSSRGLPTPLYECRPVVPDEGLCRLPEPSPGDLFLDLEGDPFADEGGREYLFGLVAIEPDGSLSYDGIWALDAESERRTFERVMDRITARCQAYPYLHVYHYAPYEPAAFKRLMGRHATRETAVDQLLRDGRFVDLYGVVRQAIVAGVERYSIKTLEPLYDFTRGVPLERANRALRVMEHALETGASQAVAGDVRDVVERYNRDDCESTFHLRQWLEGVRASSIASGVAIDRPAPAAEAETAKLDERAARVEALRTTLVVGVPSEPRDRTAVQHARWLLAYLLDWHRREDKAVWWEYFRLVELPEDELFDEPQAVAGLEFSERLGFALSDKTGRPTKSVIDRYTYPAQEMELRAKDELKLKDGTPWGTVEAVDRVACTLDVRKGPKRADDHPTSTFAHSYVNTKVLEESLLAMGDAVAAGADLAGLSGAARALLLREPPRLSDQPFVAAGGETPLDFALRIAPLLEDTCLAVQGPPGAGKTYIGSRMIARLVREKRRIGVVASSHKVIRNLLDAVLDADPSVAVGHMQASSTDDGGPVTAFTDYPPARAALEDRTVHVLGGTAWLWARPEFAESVDVLFVDEAGQMSLANVLAVSRAARSVVLLGDPQQLEQPQKGTHPDGVGASALEHLLGGHQTMPPKLGIFLPVTRRLAPAVCAFTSELFYEGRLSSFAGLEHQVISGCGDLDGSGLRLLPVSHDGNRNASSEEVDAVAALVDRFTAPGASWTDQHGVAAQLRPEDILVVAPYNAQVVRLTERLASRGIRVGTVDKFQGQEAPVVIYSMTTSRPEDAPRGLEFLYSLNRLNVATSRARCVAVLVASPRLFEPECRSPRQMLLANALCRFREMAQTVAVRSI